MMMTMNLHPLVIKIDLGRIEAERILVSAMVKLLAKRRIFFMCFHVQNNMPSLIIDYGSCASISSTTCRRATLNDKLVF